MKIQYRIKSVYGKDLIYPACDKSKTFAAMMQKKTLNGDDLMMIKSLGFETEQVL